MCEDPTHTFNCIREQAEKNGDKDLAKRCAEYEGLRMSRPLTEDELERSTATAMKLAGTPSQAWQEALEHHPYRAGAGI